VNIRSPSVLCPPAIVQVAWSQESVVPVLVCKHPAPSGTSYAPSVLPSGNRLPLCSADDTRCFVGLHHIGTLPNVLDNRDNTQARNQDCQRFSGPNIVPVRRRACRTSCHTNNGKSGWQNNRSHCILYCIGLESCLAGRFSTPQDHGRCQHLCNSRRKQTLPCCPRCGCGCGRRSWLL